MVKDDAAERTDWERVVLDRLRERLEREDRQRPAQAGWEAAAEQRLRAHFEAAD
ncbi:MAG: hypothetical protein O9284_09595 [Steroidobacteraceae bacterium]|nr:hypothetical protein [Steroidobacteraceae bacterium]